MATWMVHLRITALFIVFLAGCNENSFSIIEEDRLSNYPEVQIYVEQLQEDMTDHKGYRVFNNEEDDKDIVVIFSGGDQKLGFVDVFQSSKTTSIDFQETDSKSEVDNPYIVVMIDNIEGVFYVNKIQKTEFEGTGYYKN